MPTERDGGVGLRDLEAAASDDTAVLAISFVQYKSGFRNDLARLDPRVAQVRFDRDYVSEQLFIADRLIPAFDGRMRRPITGMLFQYSANIHIAAATYFRCNEHAEAPLINH